MLLRHPHRLLRPILIEQGQHRQRVGRAAVGPDDPRSQQRAGGIVLIAPQVGAIGGTMTAEQADSEQSI